MSLALAISLFSDLEAIDALIDECATGLAMYFASLVLALLFIAADSLVKRARRSPVDRLLRRRGRVRA